MLVSSVLCSSWVLPPPRVDHLLLSLQVGCSLRSYPGQSRLVVSPRESCLAIPSLLGRQPFLYLVAPFLEWLRVYRYLVHPTQVSSSPLSSGVPTLGSGNQALLRQLPRREHSS